MYDFSKVHLSFPDKMNAILTNKLFITPASRRKFDSLFLCRIIKREVTQEDATKNVLRNE